MHGGGGNGSSQLKLSNLAFITSMGYKIKRISLFFSTSVKIIFSLHSKGEIMSKLNRWGLHSLMYKFHMTGHVLERVVSLSSH